MPTTARQSNTKKKLTDEEKKVRRRKRDNERYAKNKDKLKAKRLASYYADPKKQVRANAVWRKKNPDKLKAQAKRAWYKQQYGLSLDDWDSLFRSQGYVCAVCGSDETTGINWHTDHCHRTGIIRGILCYSCNVGLGHFKDNPATLLAAVDYLKVHNGEQANQTV